MSSSLRLTACLRACASRRLVFNSSTGTRRPRSAIRSMISLLAIQFSLERSALSVRSSFATFRARTLRDRRKLRSALDLCGVDAAERAHQRLHRLDRQRALAFGKLPLDLAGEMDC